jgi:hypothetical protein
MARGSIGPCGEAQRGESISVAGKAIVTLKNC